MSSDIAAGERAATSWGDPQARFYADTIAASDYAARVGPLLGGDWHEVLDIGAGTGELTRPRLSPGARWIAVEPNAVMAAHLAGLQRQLSERGIVLQLLPVLWQSLAASEAADRLLAANLGATHHEPAAFFEAMRGRWRRTMHWVVAAQRGPSTFCLAGFLPAELHGADTVPAVERTLAALRGSSPPQSVQFADWAYRCTFADAGAAQAHFLDRLGLEADSARGREVCAFVARHGRPVASGLEVGCQKRSAVLTWTCA
jgi:SAM-dependent methyltransferase